MKIKKGDKAIILKGSDRRKIGTIVAVMPKEEKVIVQGINMRTFHKKPKTQDEKGTIEKKETPIPASNIALIDPNEKKATRIGYSGTGRQKQRIARRSEAVLKTTGKTNKTGRTKKGQGAVKKTVTKKTDSAEKEKK